MIKKETVYCCDFCGRILPKEFLNTITFLDAVKTNFSHSDRIDIYKELCFDCYSHCKDLINEYERTKKNVDNGGLTGI